MLDSPTVCCSLPNAAWPDLREVTMLPRYKGYTPHVPGRYIIQLPLPAWRMERNDQLPLWVGSFCKAHDDDDIEGKDSISCPAAGHSTRAWHGGFQIALLTLTPLMDESSLPSEALSVSILI